MTSKKGKGKDKDKDKSRFPSGMTNKKGNSKYKKGNGKYKRGNGTCEKGNDNAESSQFQIGPIGADRCYVFALFG